MTYVLSGSVEEVLVRTNAEAGDIYLDDFGNHWKVHDDRDGLRLEHQTNDSAQIPYWTASVIRLPGLRRADDQ